MQSIPLIKIKNKKIKNFELLDKIDEDSLIYLIDLDSTEQDKPNLDFYQKLSKKYQLWIDNAPRNLGDVVDVFIAGATNITLRKIFYPKVSLESIKDVTENKIYITIDFDECFYFEEFDGLINFYSKEELEKDFKKQDLIKNFSTKNKINIYENNKQNIKYWNKFNPECFLVDISKYEEFAQI
jgi:uncharacterized protein related to proFAR isomerase